MLAGEVFELLAYEPDVYTTLLLVQRAQLGKRKPMFRDDEGLSLEQNSVENLRQMSAKLRYRDGNRLPFCHR